MDNRLDFSFDWDLSRNRRTSETTSKSPKSSRPSQHYHEHKGNNEDRCAVCLSSGEDTMLLPCNHQFHGKCILRWVDQNFSCPLCRQEIGQFVPLNTTDKEIHQQFVEIWEKHHYGNSNESKKEDTPPAVKDNFDTSKQREISVSEVAELEEKSQEAEEVMSHVASSSSEEIKITEEEIVIAESMVYEVADSIVDTSEVIIRLDVDESQEEMVFEPSFSRQNVPTSLIYNTSRPKNLEHDVVKVLKHAGKRIVQGVTNISRSLLAQLKSREEEEETPIVSISIPRPTFYKLNESMEAGFLAGCLTASMLAAATRPANLYPLFREVIPNVAIFFTVYEDLKYRNMDPNTDTTWDCFLKRTLCAGSAATLGHLPQARFKCTVPIRFGLQFGFFEYFKDRLCVVKGLPCKDHSKLSPLAIGASACSGGIIAATCAFPVELYMKYMDVGQASYLATYQTFMRKFLPGCVFTALSFELGRRWIHTKEVDDDN